MMTSYDVSTDKNVQSKLNVRNIHTLSWENIYVYVKQRKKRQNDPTVAMQETTVMSSPSSATGTSENDCTNINISTNTLPTHDGFKQIIKGSSFFNSFYLTVTVTLLRVLIK